MHDPQVCKLPRKGSFVLFLKEKLTGESEADIIYTQWQTTDQSTLKTLVSSPSSFAELLTEAVDKLTAHSYIAKSQTKYLCNNTEQ